MPVPNKRINPILIDHSKDLVMHLHLMLARSTSRKSMRNTLPFTSLIVQWQCPIKRRCRPVSRPKKILWLRNRLSQWGARRTSARSLNRNTNRRAKTWRLNWFLPEKLNNLICNKNNSRKRIKLELKLVAARRWNWILTGNMSWGRTPEMTWWSLNLRSRRNNAADRNVKSWLIQLQRSCVKKPPDAVVSGTVNDSLSRRQSSKTWWT